MGREDCHCTIIFLFSFHDFSSFFKNGRFQDYYFVEKEEMEPKIKCIRCKVSRHNWDSKNIDMNVVGMHWFCDECDEHFMTEYISKFDKKMLTSKALKKM